MTYTPPAYPAAPRVESPRFRLTAPLGPIEAEELRWYLEQYYLWPTGVFQDRARRVEAQLPEWGQALYEAALGSKPAEAPLHAWRQVSEAAARHFSVLVDSELPYGSAQELQDAAHEAAVEFLSLPWELLHDGRSHVFHGNRAVHVRRRFPNRHNHAVAATTLPIGWDVLGRWRR